MLLLVLADLRKLATVDRGFDHYTLVGGASVYPFVWSLLLAARAEGLAGVMTTMVVRREAEVRAAFAVPDHMAVAALVALGRPVHQPDKLTAPRRRGIRHHRPPRRARPARPGLTETAQDLVRGDPSGDTTHRVPRGGHLGRGRRHARPRRRPRRMDQPPPPGPPRGRAASPVRVDDLLLAGPVHDVPVCTWVAGNAPARACNATPSVCSTPPAPGSWPGWPRPGGASPRAGPSSRTIPAGAWWCRPHRSRQRPTSCRGSSRSAMILSAVRLTGDWQAEVHLRRRLRDRL